MLKILGDIPGRLKPQKPSTDQPLAEIRSQSTPELGLRPAKKAFYVRMSKKVLFEIDFTSTELEMSSSQNLFSKLLERILLVCKEPDTINSILEGSLIGFCNKEGEIVLSSTPFEGTKHKLLASKSEFFLYPIFRNSQASTCTSLTGLLNPVSQDLSNYTFIEQFCEYNNHETYRVLCKGSGQKFLLQQYQLSGQEEVTIYTLFHQRDVLLQMLGCRYFPQLISTFQTDSCYYFLLNNEIQCVLPDLVTQKGTLSEDNCKFYTIELLLALNSLHQKGILLRQLKPEQIYLDPNGHIIIGSVERSKFIADDQALNTCYYTCKNDEIDYEEKPNIHFSIDYSEIGKLLFYMLTGTKYQTNPQESDFESFESKLRAETISPEAQSFVRGLLGRGSKKILGTNGGIEEILTHPWLNQKEQVKPLEKSLGEFRWKKMLPGQSIELKNAGIAKTRFPNSEFALHVQEELTKNRFSRESLQASHSKEVAKIKKTRAKTALRVQRRLLSLNFSKEEISFDEMLEIPSEGCHSIVIPSIFIDN